jgi:hypothetical protein
LRSAAPGPVVIRAPGSNGLGRKKQRGGRSAGYPIGSSPSPVPLHSGTGPVGFRAPAGRPPQPLLDHLDATADGQSDIDVPVQVVPCRVEMMADIAADLSTMRSLLHRVTLVAAPPLADLRRIPASAR